MSKMPRANMEEARAAWEAYPERERSYRLVIKALAEKDLACAIGTLQRWVKCNWTLKRTSRIIDPQSLQAATEQVVAKLTGRHEAEQKVMLELHAEHVQVLADHQDDHGLSRLAAREKMAAQVVLARYISKNADSIAAERPGIAIGLFEALNVPVAPIGAGAAPAIGDDARVINGSSVVIEESATALAIRAFKQRQRQGADA